MNDFNLKKVLPWSSKATLTKKAQILTLFHIPSQMDFLLQITDSDSPKRMHPLLKITGKSTQSVILSEIPS